MEQESLLVNDPLFSREAMKQYTPSKEKPSDKQRKSVKTMATKTTVAKGQAEPKLKSNSCILCKHQHDLDDCKEFKSKTVEERSNFLGIKKRCFGCNGPMTMDHNARSCTRRRKCGTCGGNHPTGLHGFRLRPSTSFNLRN